MLKSQFLTCKKDSGGIRHADLPRWRGGARSPSQLSEQRKRLGGGRSVSAGADRPRLPSSGSRLSGIYSPAKRRGICACANREKIWARLWGLHFLHPPLSTDGPSAKISPNFTLSPTETNGL